MARVFTEINDRHLFFTGERLPPGTDVTIIKRSVRLYDYKPVQVAGFVDSSNNQRWLLCSEAGIHHGLWKE